MGKIQTILLTAAWIQVKSQLNFFIPNVKKINRIGGLMTEMGEKSEGMIVWGFLFQSILVT